MSVGSPEWYTHIYILWTHRHAILLNPYSKTFAFLFWVRQWIFGSVLEKFTKDKKNALCDVWTWFFLPTWGFLNLGIFTNLRIFKNPQVGQKVQTYLGIFNEHSTFYIISQLYCCYWTNIKLPMRIFRRHCCNFTQASISWK